MTLHSTVVDVGFVAQELREIEVMKNYVWLCFRKVGWRVGRREGGAARGKREGGGGGWASGKKSMGKKSRLTGKKNSVENSHPCCILTAGLSGLSAK